MKVLEVNDNDIFGKIFNGYLIMEELNKNEKFDVKQLVINKLSDNENCKKLFKTRRMISQESFIYAQEQEKMSTHSLLSSSTKMLENNEYYKECDLVHFHQVHNAKLPLDSFFQLAKSKPTVISFHDMWFMTGRCVQTYGCEKWKNGCKGCESLNTLFNMTYDNCAELWKIKSKIKDTDVDIIVHSKFMYDMAKENPYTKDLRVHEIPLGIDMKKYDFKLTKEEAKRKLNIFKNDIVIFFRENMELKGTNYVVNALKKIKNKSNITLICCDQTGFLKEIENDFKVIEFGVLDEEKLLLCYNAADLFLMPSPGETFGMMAVEAMAAGVPTLVFNNTALPDTTGAPEIGILVNNEDADDLYKKIQYYIDNPDERAKRGQMSKEFVANKYSYDKYFESISKVYKSSYKNQRYKLEKEDKKIDRDIDYNDINSKKILNKLNMIYEEYNNIFENEKKPEFLENEKAIGDDIAYSNENVLGIIDKFNSFLYQDLLENTEEKLIKKSKDNHKKSNKSNVTKGGQDKMDNVELQPKVSIIMPVYNGGKYVSMAIDSALRQSYKNIEIIVVNDGSKDNTDEICKSYGDKIKYIKKENGGVSTALNRGIKEMTGDYFSWLSHDDLYYPEKVETEINYLIEHNLLNTNTILYSNYSTMDGNGKFMNDALFDSTTLNKDSILSLLKGAINGLTLLIPKKAFDDAGGFSEELRCIQDYKLWYDMYKCGYKFVHIPDVLTVTRIHAEQVTNTSPKVVTEGNVFWRDLIDEISDEKKIDLYGSIYEFYYELYKFFSGGPYDEIVELCKKKCEEIENQNRDRINQTKVTVGISFYNDISSTIRAVKSVLNQAHKNIEIILINNGSTDSINEINKLVEENGNIVKYITNERKLPNVEIWREIFDKSTGEYVVLFDQYSCMEENRIEQQVSKMIVSNVPISNTSYYENRNNNSSYIDCGFEDGDIVHKLINCCYYKMPILMLNKEYIEENNILDIGNIECAEDVNLILKTMIDNRILGINEPLTVIYPQEIHEKLEDRFAAIIGCVTSDKRFYKYKNEINILINGYKGLLDRTNAIDEREEYIKIAHQEELKRYAYMQSEECQEVEKIRCIMNKILFRRKIPYYQLDNNAIMNSGINKWYRKHKEKKERGK